MCLNYNHHWQQQNNETRTRKEDKKSTRILCVYVCMYILKVFVQSKGILLMRYLPDLLFFYPSFQDNARSVTKSRVLVRVVGFGKCRGLGR